MLVALCYYLLVVLFAVLVRWFYLWFLVDDAWFVGLHGVAWVAVVFGVVYCRFVFELGLGWLCLGLLW